MIYETGVQNASPIPFIVEGCKIANLKKYVCKLIKLCKAENNCKSFIKWVVKQPLPLPLY